MKLELTRNDFLIQGVTKFIKIYLLLISLLTLFRTIFVIYFSNLDYISNNILELAYAFFMGWRYDTIVASYLLIPFLISILLTSLMKVRLLSNLSSFIFGIYFFIFFNIITLLSICDLGFYSYFQDHLNILFFGFFEDDTVAVVKSIWKNYPLEYALVGYSFYIAFIAWVLKRTFKFIHRDSKSIMHKGMIKFSLISIILLVAILGGARGGYGILVLSPKYADFSKSLFINQAALNGIITFEKAYKLRRSRSSMNFNMAKALGYGDNIHRAFSDYLGFDTSPTQKEKLINLLERKTPLNPTAENLKPNVIVLLMESFGAHWSKYNSDTFNFLGDLDKNFKEDYSFKNFISSDNGTIGSLMVLGTNIPHRAGARFISESRYMQLPLGSAAHVPFKESGYETNFLYGGKLGWRDIGKYFTYQGIDFVEGESHIRESLNLKGKQGTEWGLYDEHFFEHIYKKLSSTNRPQFLLGLSTSNHPPFEVPDTFSAPELILPKELKERISREEDLFIQRFKAFQYSNFKLAEFINKVKNSKLKDNTIIIVTGDHNFWGFMNYEKSESFLKYTVPLYIYVPDSLKPRRVNLSKFGSHEDIMTTAYNLALSDKSYLSFGEDLFSTTGSISMNGSIIASGKGAKFSGKFYEWSADGLLKPDASNIEDKELIKQNNSSLSIADFYLRNELKKSLKSKKRQ
jgi:phosphoglycerol transferase MdoB-like AlkP superfamily enzyme